MKINLIKFLVFAVLCTLATGNSLAQQAINTDAASQPAQGRLMVRPLYRYFEADFNPNSMDRDISHSIVRLTLAYGLNPDITVIGSIPFMFRDIDFKGAMADRDDSGVGDIKLIGKFKLYADNPSVTDVTRFSVIGGMEIRSGDSNFSSDSYDPIVGIAYSHIRGRHGLDLITQLQINTGGDADKTIKYDAAYLFRVYPEEYAADTKDAFYAVAELNGRYETNGDNEIFLSPGFIYVQRDWAIEATIQLPVWQELENRPERDFILGIGVRLLF